MNIKSGALLLLAFFLAVPSRVALTVTDESEPGSPLRVSGSAVATDTSAPTLRYEFEQNLTLLNTSRKKVMLFIVTVEFKQMAKLGIEARQVHDYFFSCDSIAPNDSVTLHEIDGPFGEPSTGGNEARGFPEAIAHVDFAEFEDGTVWGNSSVAADTLKTRQETLVVLGSLLRTYTNSGSQAFVSELVQHRKLPAIAQLQELYRARGNTGVVIAEVKKMLECAVAHGAPRQSLVGNGSAATAGRIEPR